MSVAPFALFAVLAFSAPLAAVENPAVPNKPRRARQPATGSVVFRTEVPARDWDVVLGRPTTHSVVASVLAFHDTTARVQWWRDGAAGPRDERIVPLRAGEPLEVAFENLSADTAYRYSVEAHTVEPSSGTPAPLEGRFHTARPPGTGYTFVITADSHLDENTDAAVYLRALRAASARQPDFLVDLGDTFMGEKRPRVTDALPQYLAQRFYFSRVAASAPLFLTLGNHDGEGGREDDGTADSRAVWCALTRKRFFPNPEPDAFYSGNGAVHPRVGRLQNYYAWTWGDALFVVLDPFWPTPRLRRNDDGWGHTLGQEQYDWLSATLAASRARFKFVFIHHLVGGGDRQSRGGVEASHFFEWGGDDPTGRRSFAQMRPGWMEPIHALLVRHGVTAVFHGHDHLFAEQERDGVLYQEVPQPGHRRGGANRAADYGYREGVILDGSGFLAVTVGPDVARVEFVDCAAQGAEAGKVVHLRALEPQRASEPTRHESR